MSFLSSFLEKGRNATVSTAAMQESETVPAQILPVYAAADWEPAPRTLAKSAFVAASDEQDPAALVKAGFRSIILAPSFAENPAEELELLRSTLDQLKEQGVFRTIALELPAAGEQQTLIQLLGGLVSSSSFDALVIRDGFAGDAAGSALKDFAQALSLLLEQTELSLPVIFEVQPGLLEQQNAAAYLQVVKAQVAAQPAAELLLPDGSAAQLKAWQDFVKPADAAKAVPVTALLSLKTALKDGTLEDALAFFSSLKDYSGYALAFRHAQTVPGDGKAAQLLAKYFSDELELSALEQKLTMRRPFKELKKEQSIKTDEPEITFTGRSNPLFLLTCDGREVARNESGDFSLEFLLKAGKNTFVFAHQGESFTVHVTYSVKVLESVSPNTRIETTGGVELAVRALALRGADVKAELDGQVITLKPGAADADEGGYSHEEEASFITYAGTFRLPESGAKEVSLGYVHVSAVYKGVTDQRTGAKVIILKAPAPVPAPPPTTEAAATTATKGSTAGSGGTGKTGDTSTAKTKTTAKTTTKTESTAKTTVKTETTAKAKALLTPYADNGVGGKSQMVEITADYADARSNSIVNNSDSIPRISPLLEGTFDYVVGQDTYSGITYYHLSSGKRVAKDDLKLIPSGYNLPGNAVQASSSVKSGTLTLRFGVTWKIPFNVDLTGQSYVASNNYEYGVKSFSATGLEIVFSHTSAYGGKVDISSFPLLSGAEWSKSSSKNTSTLKLTLREAGRFYGWQAVYEGSELVIRIFAKPPKTLEGATIMLDPGHGGGEVGSELIASHDVLKTEKQINLLIAQKLQKKLKSKGATVLMTRTTETTVTLDQREAMQRKAAPDIYISIHCDSFKDSSVMGTSAFYYRAFSFPLADAIHKRIVAVYQNQLYTDANYGSAAAALREKVDRKTKFFPFHVSRVEECPSILIEYGFGSNLRECGILMKDQNQELFAQATLEGIEDYLKAQH
jgi:N-acetylmuramoyl-L-alanine amidase